MHSLGDGITVTMPPAKRARVSGTSLEHVRAHNVRIGAAYLTNGTITPISSEAEVASPTSASASLRFPRDTQPRSSLQATAEDVSESDDHPNSSSVRLKKKSFRVVSTEESQRLQSRAAMVDLEGPAFPQHMYQGYKISAELRKEYSAMWTLQTAFYQKYPVADQRPQYTYFMLNDFSIYRPSYSKYHADELVTLEKLTLRGKGEFFLAGILSFEDERLFVKDVPFDILTLEYGVSQPWRDRVCIQSRIAKDQNVYYKLGRPARAYDRFYAPFLLIAQFADYFIEYLCEHKHVTIAKFRHDFWNWLQPRYGEDPSFQAWHRNVKLLDFRTQVATQVEFLWKECWSIDDQSARAGEPTSLCEHPIWSEIHPDMLEAIPKQPVDYLSKTVVTPYAYTCFQNMYFADQLGVHYIQEDALRDRVSVLKSNLGLTPLYHYFLMPEAPDVVAQPLQEVSDVCIGDVVVIPADKTGSWKQSTTDLWYAYVQRIWKASNGSRRLDVIWLYQPEDTTIGNAPYLFRNELFLSDNCGCGEAEALYLDDIADVIGIAEVSWFATDPAAEGGLFVRRTFRTVPELNQYDFVTLQSHHFRCCHQEGYIDYSDVKYKIGDSVLIRQKQDSIGRNCRPAIIVGFPGEDRVSLNKLYYAREVSRSDARPNELVLSAENMERDTDSIVRPCHIRLFDRVQIERGLVPTPYNRDGTGDFFYVARDSQSILPAGLLLNEGWNPQQHDSRPKLTGLGLFCGGGTFDRGLEEGGAVHFRYAVDIAEEALHSYRANTADPEQTSYYLGSVNEYLASALAGESSDIVAEPGSIHVISAGSPCQGFSNLQQCKDSDRSKRNASMVASVISYVDLYAPRYLILENVIAMTTSIKEHGGQNVFSQMIAALVGLGYQVQQFLMDAYYYGSSQARSRVFILASAPICEVLEQQDYTHARPTELERMLHLGKCSNGKPFGSRQEEAYFPFAQVSAEESVGDLPVVFDGQPLLCPQFPDHRTATEETVINRDRIAAVPKRPFGMSLKRAALAGLVRGEPLDFSNGHNQIRCGPNSNSYRRIFPNRPFPTIITIISVTDGIAGQVVHWNEDRVLTIMETRRAQGLPDDEVLVGLPAERLKIVGNGVDRKVALVLGLSLRKSWQKSPLLDDVINDDAFEAVDHQSIDNRTVKMALNLSEDDIASIRTGGFKRIKTLLSRLEHRSARQSLHSGDQEKEEKKD